MKKSLKILILAGMASLLALTGCDEILTEPVQENTITAENTATAAVQPISHWQGLRMYVEAGGVTPTGLRLSIINDSEALTFGHGVPFRIDQYQNGVWSPVPIDGDIAWIQPLLIVEPGFIRDEDISWQHMHGQLPPGQYRIVRNFIDLEHEAYLYALFTVEEDWQTAHSAWQTQQAAIAAAAYARFDGLDLEILQYSPRGLSFTLTNNNPYYSYIIYSVFMGWEDRFPDGGHSAAVEYFIFSRWQSSYWPSGREARLSPGESLSLDVDWYRAIGNLAPRIFDLVVDVALDVDEDYKQEHFSRALPGLPGAGHRIRAHFEVQ